MVAERHHIKTSGRKCGSPPCATSLTATSTPASTSRPPEEESLATILLRELARHREEKKELSLDQCPEPAENKELTRKSQGEGGT